MNRRILIYTKDPKGGTGTFVTNLNTILKSNKFKIRFVAHRNDTFSKVKCKKIGFLFDKQEYPTLKTIFLSIVNIICLAKEIIEYKPTYLYTLDLYANVSSLILKLTLFPDIVLINSTHVNLRDHITADRNTIFSSSILLLIKFLYPFASLHVTPSFELSSNVNRLVSNDKLVIKTIHYPIDKKRIINLSRQQKVSMKFTLVTLARLDNQKKVELLIQSVIHYNNLNKKNISLQVVGNGNLETHLRTRYSNFKYIEFIGWKKNPYPYLLNARIFILISNYEGLPYSILEAMTLGRPVIASDVNYGPREIIRNNKYGLLTKNAIEDISDNISTMLIKRNYLKYQHYSLLRARAFDLKKLSNQYLSLFSS